MKKRTRSGLRAVLATLVACLWMPAGARAQAQIPIEAPRPPIWAMVLDVVILRPLGLAVLPVGVAAFIPAALLTAPGGLDKVQEALELFVTAPANYVFQRPLGEV
ncbi:MAG TPA: hypothetical protein VII72_05555 [Myxococcota bacterium]|jgi:hypothetical protein